MEEHLISVIALITPVLIALVAKAYMIFKFNNQIGNSSIAKLKVPDLKSLIF